LCPSLHAGQSRGRQPLARHGKHSAFQFQQTQEEHMRKSLAVFLSGVAMAATVSTALAGEQVLEFKLVTKPIDFKIT
jgi:hypothetical protein